MGPDDRTMNWSPSESASTILSTMLASTLGKVASASTSASAALVSTSAESKYEVLDTTVNPVTKKRLLSKTASSIMVGLLTVLDYR